MSAGLSIYNRGEPVRVEVDDFPEENGRAGAFVTVTLRVGEVEVRLFRDRTADVISQVRDAVAVLAMRLDGVLEVMEAASDRFMGRGGDVVRHPVLTREEIDRLTEGR